MGLSTLGITGEVDREFGDSHWISGSVDEADPSCLTSGGV